MKTVDSNRKKNLAACFSFSVRISHTTIITIGICFQVFAWEKILGKTREERETSEGRETSEAWTRLLNTVRIRISSLLLLLQSCISFHFSFSSWREWHWFHFVFSCCKRNILQNIREGSNNKGIVLKNIWNKILFPRTASAAKICRCPLFLSLSLFLRMIPVSYKRKIEVGVGLKVKQTDSGCNDVMLCCYNSWETSGVWSKGCNDQKSERHLMSLRQRRHRNQTWFSSQAYSWLVCRRRDLTTKSTEEKSFPINSMSVNLEIPTNLFCRESESLIHETPKTVPHPETSSWVESYMLLLFLLLETKAGPAFIISNANSQKKSHFAVYFVR